MNTNMTGFRLISKMFASCPLDESIALAFEGLRNLYGPTCRIALRNVYGHVLGNAGEI